MRILLTSSSSAAVRRRSIIRSTMSSSSSSSSSLSKRQKPLVFVTGNANKLKEVEAILGKHVPSLTNKKIDLPELQGEPLDISVEKCKLAANAIGGPVIVEDTSLCYNALGGLPGVYIKWFLEKIGHDGLNKLLHAYEDKTAYAQCIFAFSRGPGYEPVTFVGRCHGRIVPPQGPTTFGWDPIFMPQGLDVTFATMSKETKNQVSHRAKALEVMAKYFSEHPHILDEEAAVEAVEKRTNKKTKRDNDDDRNESDEKEQDEPAAKKVRRK